MISNSRKSTILSVVAVLILTFFIYYLISYSRKTGDYLIRYSAQALGYIILAYFLKRLCVPIERKFALGLIAFFDNSPFYYSYRGHNSIQYTLDR